MKTIASIFAATAMMTGFAMADPEGVSGELVGLEGAAKFTNVWVNDDIENPMIESVEVKNGPALTEEDYDSAM